MGMFGTLFAIALVSHMLCCAWYLVGIGTHRTECDAPSDNSTTTTVDGYDCVLRSDENVWTREIDGWVNRMEYAQGTATGTKYVDSMYSILKGSFAYTNDEKTVGKTCTEQSIAAPYFDGDLRDPLGVARRDIF
jgi:hypothetical protein